MIVGFDRVAANGDVANKVGTYGARARRARRGHPVRRRRPVLVASTRRCPTATGSRSRSATPTRCAARGGALLTLPGTPCRNPAFDVTPAELVTALVTERGVARPVERGRRVARRRREGRARTLTRGHDGRRGGARSRSRARARSSAACSPARLRLRRPVVATSRASSRPCSATSRPARWSRSARASTGVAVGDRVAIHHHAPCGECRRCRRGHETLCERFRATGLDPGGFAERVRVPAELVGELLPLDGWTRCARRSSSRWPARCAPSDRGGLRPGDALLVVGAGCERPAADRRRARAGRRGGVGARAAPERLERARALGRRAPRQRAGRRRDRLHAARRTRSPAAAGALAPGGALCLYAPPPPGQRRSASTATPLFLRELDVTASLLRRPGRHARGARRCSRAARVDPLRARHPPASRSRRPARALDRAARAARRSRRVVAAVRAARPPRARRPARRGGRPSRGARRGRRARRGGHRVRDRREDVAPRAPVLGAYPARFGHETAGRPRGHRRAGPRRRLACLRGLPRPAAPGGRRSAATPRWVLGGFAERDRRAGGRAAPRSRTGSSRPAPRWPSRSRPRCTRVARGPRASSRPTPECSAAGRWARCSPRCSCSRAAR